LGRLQELVVGPPVEWEDIKMSAGKTKIIVDEVNYRNSADPLRALVGKYWTRESEKQFSLFKKGFDSEAGESLAAPGNPVQIHFINEPTLNEERDYYEFEQKIVLKANTNRMSKEADPASAWESLISEAIQDVDKIAWGATGPMSGRYSDHAFSIDLPYSERELKILNIKQKVNSADIKPIYNFYIEGYEEEIVKQKIPEQLLPNLYVFTQAEMNGNTAYDIQDDDLDGLISLGGRVPETMQKITKKRKNPLNEPTLQEDPSDQYYKNYGKHYKSFAKNDKRKMNRMRNRYSTISFTNDVIENIAEYNEKKYIFPMYTNIRFTTDRSTYVAEILKHAGLSSSFMKYVMETEAKEGLPRMRFAEAHKKVSETTNKKLEKAVKMKTLFRVKNLATFDLLKWWEEHSGDKQDSASTLSSMAMMIGQNQNAADHHSKIRNAYMQQVLDTVFQSKFRKFIKNFTRSYRSMLNGDLSYSETLMYKIQKFLGNPRGKPIQTFYTCNSNEIDVLTLLDTQVKYNTEYTYVVTAYQMVLGTEYEYKNVSTGEQTIQGADSDQPITQYLANATIVYRPSLKIVEVPIYAEKERIIDNPPVTPDIDIIPYRAISDKLLFNFMGNVGEYDLQPVFFNEEERIHYEKIRRAQKLLPGEPIRFKSDDPAAVFEVFRITKKPKSYMDFKDSKRASVQTDVSLETMQKAATASYLERLQPNTKYYYIFRSIDVHGHISYPSAVYEVELVNDAGTVFPRIAVVDFEPEVRSMPSKSMKKYIHVIPSVAQALVNPEKSGLVNEYDEPIDSALLSNGHIQLGFQESPIWNKKFKVRITSRQTGRKIDLNLRFDQKHVVTEDDFKHREAYRAELGRTTRTPRRVYGTGRNDIEMNQDDLMDLL
jgi:hypothetical protein